MSETRSATTAVGPQDVIDAWRAGRIDRGAVLVAAFLMTPPEQGLHVPPASLVRWLTCIGGSSTPRDAMDIKRYRYQLRQVWPCPVWQDCSGYRAAADMWRTLAPAVKPGSDARREAVASE